MANLKIGQDYHVNKSGNVMSYPTGSVIIINSSTIPDGWLLCDGRPVNTFDYQDLHRAITNTYGGTAFLDGTTNLSGAATTFNLPPLVINATYNPSGRYAVSAQSSEPSYPSNFIHTHYFYKGSGAAYNGVSWSGTHTHSELRMPMNAGTDSHSHLDDDGANVVNNVTSNAATSRYSSSNNTVEYHNDYSHDHGGASSTTLSSNPGGATHGAHYFFPHSGNATISQSHTVAHSNNVVVGGTTYEGISISSTAIPASKEVYFIIKY